MAADKLYKGKVNFVLCNMASLGDAEKYAKDKGLQGNATHGHGKPPADYGIKYIPHKVLIDKNGKVVKNFDLKSLQVELDDLLAKGGAIDVSSSEQPKKEESNTKAAEEEEDE